MFDRYPESIEMRMPAVVSGMLHVVLLGAAVLNLNFFNRPPLMESEPVMVDFEMIDKKAAAPKVGNPPPQPKDVPIAEEATKAPPPKSAEPPPAPEKPKPDVAEAKPTPPAPVEKPQASRHACSSGSSRGSLTAHAACTTSASAKPPVRSTGLSNESSLARRILRAPRR